MSFNSEYQALRKKRKKQEEETTQKVVSGNPLNTTKQKTVISGNPLKTSTKDLAPIRTVSTLAPVTSDAELTLPIIGELDLFQEGALKSGVTAKNVGKAILGTTGDIALGSARGVMRFAEGIGDAINYGIAGVSDLLGADEWAEGLRNETKKSVTDQLFGDQTQKVAKWSVLGDSSRNLTEQIGNFAIFGGLGALGNVAGLGKAGITALTTGTMGASGLGSGMSEAYQGGATDEQALKHGLNVGTIEALSELLFGGMGKAVNSLGFSKGITSIDDMFAKKVSNQFTSQFAKNVAEYSVKAGAEGVEEIVAGVGNILSKKFTLMSDKDWLELIEDENLLEQFFAGTLSSGFAQSYDLYQANKSGKDFITDLTQNEQSVVDKEVENRVAEAEKDGKTLTNKEKNKIYDAVINDLDKGYISTDTIEEVLGGETYKSYKDTVEKEDALYNRFEELGNKENATLKDQHEYSELAKLVEEYKSKSQRTQLKSQLGDEVFNIAKNSRLVESYNERARKGQLFEADYSKFKDAKHQDAVKQTLENAVNSKINNTNRMRDVVEMNARFSGDTGLVFHYKSGEEIKNNFIERQTAKIKELESIAERTPEQNEYIAKLKDKLEKVKSGKIKVNGEFIDGGVVINLDSPTAFQFTTGHEVTHKLEKANSYENLVEALKRFAGKDFDKRVAEQMAVYEGVSGYELETLQKDVEREVVADLVGEYLFTDEKFINNLSTENPNLFKRIYNEIKYLCKIATAGSKEARELEKVKRAFEKAYKESANTKADTKNDTKLSLSEEGNYGYHAGDLGKAEGYWNMTSSNRSTGHFGTGTYFVGDEAQISRKDTYGNRPHEKVDFSNYNLYKPLLESYGFELHDQLKYINNNISQYPIASMSFDEIWDVCKSVEGAQYTLYYDENATETEKAEAKKILAEMEERFESIEFDSENWYADDLKEKLKEISGSYQSATIRLNSLFGYNAEEKINSALESVYNEVSQIEDSYNARYEDSPSTRFMKAMGYEGIDVRGIKGLDNTTYGSVIYDLKGDDLARKKEIGTAKYSLSAQQEEYFKDSVVRDDNGNLKVMYHGTSKGGHTVFDTYGSNYGLFGQGSYFTDNKSVAESYTNKGKGNNKQVYESYLNITKPLDMDAQGNIEEWQKAFPDADFSNCNTNEEFYRAVEEFYADQMMPKWEVAEEIKDTIQFKMGYDGITHIGGGRVNADGTRHQVYIAFEPEQIKNIDNIAPTKDADIRYSLSSMANTFFEDPNMSANDFMKVDYKQTQGYKDYVEQCVNNYRQTRVDFDETVARKEVEDQIDGIVRVAIASKNAGYDIADDSQKRNLRDSKKRLLFSSLEPNSEYTTSHDISTLCDKRRNFAEIYDAIVKREEALGVPQGKRFFDNVDNYFYIHKVLADKGLTQPCRQCYVESMRKNLTPMATAFLELVNETNPNNKSNKQLYQQSGKNKGNLKSNNAKLRERVLDILTEYDMSVDNISMETLTTEDGLAQLRLQAPLVYEAFNSFYGQSKPKMPKSATPFRFGELTALLTDENGKIKQSLVDNIKSTGGFRLQSYSDFQIENFVDTLQVLFEAGTLGLNAHAYTKVPAFLDATEGTNLKRNISIFMYKDGDEWKLDKNDSFPYDLEEIYDIVKNDKSGNTSIIAVSQNADMSAWIMANDNVGYFIPFHKSGLKMGTVRDTDIKTEDGRTIKGYSGTIDHTKQQTEVWAKTTADHKANTKVKKAINIYSFWDFDNKSNLSKNDLIKKNVKAYIDACEMAGYLPKFRDYVMNNDKLLNNVLKYSKKLGFASQDATIDDISFEYKGYRIPYGYYKCLGDFGMFTPDGKASPHDTVSLANYDFDKAEAFFNDAQTLRRNEILQQFANGEERRKYRDSDLTAGELEDIVKQKRNEVADSIVAPTRYSLSADTPYAPTFYSQMGRVVDDIKQDKIGASSVVNYLKGKGVKNEEIKWSGIEEFVEGKKSVTKQELQEFVANSMLQIEESDFGGDAVHEFWEAMRDFDFDLQEGDITIDNDFHDNAVAFFQEALFDGDIGHDEYNHLLTLTENVVEQQTKGGTKWHDYKLPNGENYRELIFKMPNSSYSNRMMRTHWGEDAKGVLAHARVQDMTDTEGNKVLFIEEIQSDWHNEGAKNGYTDKGEIKFTIGEYSDDFIPQADIKDNYGEQVAEISKVGEVFRVYEPTSGQLWEVDTESDALDILELFVKDKYVEDAPFRNNYHEFVLKNLIREATEKGYDKIAWTTGEMQEERWSSDYAEGYRIEYDQDIPKFLNKYGKKWGAKVGTTTLNNQTVWSMDVTDSMKNSVLYEGQPFYSLLDADNLPKLKGSHLTYGEDIKLRTAEDIAPVVESTPTETVAENTTVAPIQAPTQEYEAIKPRPEKLVGEEEQWAKNKMARAGKVKRVKVKNTEYPSNDSKEKQRKWVGTSTNSDVVNREILPDDLGQSKITYQPISNKVTLKNANTRLDSMGYEDSVTYFNGQFTNRQTTLDDIALGERLIQEAMKRGDTKTAGELIQNVAILGTELGQKVQALSIIKRLTPEGQLRMLQKTVERGKTKGDKAFEGVEITQEMIDRILKTYGKDGTYNQEDLNEAVEDVKKDIAKQMKVTTLDKVNAWRYLSMLGNPKTHIRNIVSNVAMKGTLAVKNVVARSIESIAPIENRTKTFTRATEEIKQFAEQTTTEMQDVITGDSKYSESESIKAKREIFKNKILNGVYEFNSDMLSKEDWWFSKSAFKNALSEFLTANGIKTMEDIKKNPKLVEKAKLYATEQSQIATFRQYSWLANKVNEIERKNTATNIAVGSIIPFKKTPINIAKTGLNYSPLGFAKTLTYDAMQVKKGNMEASEMIDHLAQNITGTSLALVGFMLASTGFLNGSGEDDEEGKYDYQLGEQAYSVTIGDATFSLSWLSPVAMPLFVGANAYEQLVEGKEWNGDVVVETLSQTLDPLSEMSFLSSLDSVLSSYDSGIQKFAGIGEAMAQNYITQFAPTLGSQVATVFDDTKRSTKIGADSEFKAFDSTINKLVSKIPFLRNTLEPSTDIWGNDVKQTDNLLTRAFESFLAPYSKREDISTSVDDEIKSIYKEVGDSGLIPSVPDNYINYKNEKYKMSAEEYTTFKKTYGQTANSLLEGLFSNTAYLNATTEEKAEMILDVYDYARDEAKKEYLSGKGIDYTNATSKGEAYYKENPIKGAIENNMTTDEYDMYSRYPEKYAVLQEQGISVKDYKENYEETAFMYTDDFSWASQNPEKYTLSKAVTSDVTQYKQYTSDLYNIRADKDKNGKSISGSAKEKKIDYINNLDIDYGAKLILFKSEYNADDTYNNEIIDYLNNRDDLTYEEKVAILKELGFNVDSNGNISW